MVTTPPEPPRFSGPADSSGPDEAPEAVRKLISSWVADSRRGTALYPADEPGAAHGVSALGVPPASASTVIRTARRLTASDQAPQPLPPEEALHIARALVVDEHPSVRNWSTPEYQEAVEWVGRLIHRDGEDGVERLLVALRSEQ